MPSPFACRWMEAANSSVKRVFVLGGVIEEEARGGDGSEGGGNDGRGVLGGGGSVASNKEIRVNQHRYDLIGAYIPGRVLVGVCCSSSSSKSFIRLNDEQTLVNYPLAISFPFLDSHSPVLRRQLKYSN